MPKNYGLQSLHTPLIKPPGKFPGRGGVLQIVPADPDAFLRRLRSKTEAGVAEAQPPPVRPVRQIEGSAVLHLRPVPEGGEEGEGRAGAVV